MNTHIFNDLEAKFIAKEILLKRLGIESINEDICLTHSKAYNKTLAKIESIENTWEYTPDDIQHTYGRKHLGETIKLWSVPSMTAKVLENLVIYTGAKNILEIGTSAGYSTIHLANATKHIDGKVYTIELLDEKVKLANTHFKEADLEDTITL